MPRYEPWSAERASVIIAANKHRDGAALPIFHAFSMFSALCRKRRSPWSPRRSICPAPRCTGRSPSITTSAKSCPGRRVLKLCRAESCQAAGGDALAARAEEKLGVKMGGTTRGQPRDARGGLLPRALP